MTLDTHGLIIDFGKFAGEPYTRAPVSYLRWMVDSDHSNAEIAIAELARRGIALVDSPIEISCHAIDSASLRCWKIYRDTRTSRNQGLHSWLVDICVNAMVNSDLGDDGEIYYLGMKLVIAKGALRHTLKTIMRDTRK